MNLVCQVSPEKLLRQIQSLFNMLLGIVRDEKNSFAVTNRTVFFQKQWSDPPTGFLNFGTEQRQPLKIYKKIYFNFQQRLAREWERVR